MRERPNRHAWKACDLHGSVGSNPTLSATVPVPSGTGSLSARRRRSDLVGCSDRHPAPHAAPQVRASTTSGRAGARSIGSRADHTGPGTRHGRTEQGEEAPIRATRVTSEGSNASRGSTGWPSRSASTPHSSGSRIAGRDGGRSGGCWRSASWSCLQYRPPQAMTQHSLLCVFHDVASY